MILVKSTLEWAAEHAVKSSDGFYYCKKTKYKLHVKRIRRTIDNEDDLEVRRVGHVYCPSCEPEPKFPEGEILFLTDLSGYEPYLGFHRYCQFLS